MKRKLEVPPRGGVKNVCWGRGQGTGNSIKGWTHGGGFCLRIVEVHGTAVRL